MSVGDYTGNSSAVKCLMLTIFQYVNFGKSNVSYITKCYKRFVCGIN